MSKSSEAKSRGGPDIKVESFRILVQQYLDLGLWSAAIFWADKVLALNKGQGGNDVWLVAKCMLQKGEYHRAAHTISSRGLHKTHLLCHYVTIKALIEAKEHQSALQIMTDNEPEYMEHTLKEIPKNRVLAAVYVARGIALTELERRVAAAEALVSALRIDVHCYEALNLLLEQHALTPTQERELIENLPIGQQCPSVGHTALISEVYAAQADRYGRRDDDELPLDASDDKDEAGNTDILYFVMAWKRIRAYSSEYAISSARRLLHRCAWSAAERRLGSAWQGAELRVACLVELKRAPELFAFAHALVDKYPQSAVSWFAVGCYYFLTGKNQFARRYLSKATSLDRGLGCAWLAYGHSFAADKEHDQAMAAYFKASQLMPGCHLPHLYIGVECALSNNAKMAVRFLTKATGFSDDANLSLDMKPGPDTRVADAPVIDLSDLLIDDKDISQCSEVDGEGGSCGRRGRALHVDPHVAHEAGAVAFAAQHYHQAEALWRKTLGDVQRVHGTVPERWHALLDNLGHACRKNGKYEESLSFHRQALTCKPASPSTYSAMGLCLALMGKTDSAIDAFHSALSKNPDDTFSTTMLSYLIEQYADGSDDDIPHFPFPNINLNLAGSEVPSDARTPVPVGIESESQIDPDNVTLHSDMSMSFED